MGLGAVGKGMARHCIEQGFRLMVHDIRPREVRELVSADAQDGESVKAIAAAADVIITVPPTGREVDDIVMEGDGISRAPKPGTLVVDFLTIDPENTDKLHAARDGGGAGGVFDGASARRWRAGLFRNGGHTV